MTSFLDKNAKYGLALVRVGVGAMMLLVHGIPKLGRNPSMFPDPLGVGNEISYYLAVFSEVFCSGLLVVGLGTRLASIPLFITMMVAAFVFHADNPFAKKEMALLYAQVYLLLILFGGGHWSLSKKMGWLRKYN